MGCAHIHRPASLTHAHDCTMGDHGFGLSTPYELAPQHNALLGVWLASIVCRQRIGNRCCSHLLTIAIRHRASPQVATRVSTAHHARLRRPCQTRPIKTNARDRGCIRSVGAVIDMQVRRWPANPCNAPSARPADGRKRSMRRKSSTKPPVRARQICRTAPRRSVLGDWIRNGPSQHSMIASCCCFAMPTRWPCPDSRAPRCHHHDASQQVCGMSDHA